MALQEVKDLEARVAALEERLAKLETPSKPEPAKLPRRRGEEESA